MNFGIQDQRYFDAAEGWLALGNCHEANEELEQLTPEFRSHPDVLFLRYEIYEKAEKWECAFEVARAITIKSPDCSLAYVYMAYCLHELKRTQEALDVLLSVVDKFPKYYNIHYNVACYWRREPGGKKGVP